MKRRPQAEQKILNYLRELIDSPSFQKDIYTLRKKLGIPPNGFPMNEEDEEAYEGFRVLHTPSATDWHKAQEGRVALRDILDQFPVNNFFITHGFFLYLFHNRIFPHVFEEGVFWNSVCRLENMRAEFRERERPSWYLNQYFDNLLKTYPVAIFL